MKKRALLNIVKIIAGFTILAYIFAGLMTFADYAGNNPKLGLFYASFGVMLIIDTIYSIKQRVSLKQKPA
ncbi:MAG: hypothetical protein KBC67_03115 [Candidatus Pacebacteria bacterium]|nr:hypothetical protein [Candidatus Paceibacterota bacterium]